MPIFLNIIFTLMFFVSSFFAFAGDIYHCPMHHQVQSDKPGNCYICGMALVKMEVKGVSQEKAQGVSIAQDQMRLMGIRTVPIKKEVLAKTVRAAGYVSTIRKLYQYQVIAQIYENDLGFVDVGQDVDIEIPAYLEHAKGKIRSIARVLDPQTHTANAWIELQGYKGELKGNMFVNVSIFADLNEGLIVPYAAVMDTGLQKIVYVQKGEGIFEARSIQVSAPGDQGWMVKSGLKEGEKVVVDGNFLLDSESRLQESIGGENP